VARLIDLSLEEDLGRGDVTTEVVGAMGEGIADIVSREPLVVCGLPVLGWVLERAAPELRSERIAGESTLVPGGAVLARISGPVASILRVERTALNFLMRLSGVATLTRRFVDAVRGTGARVVDTRKTLPGWRVLDKYAVRVGGGDNHRADLASGILIKDNHLAACGGVGQAVRAARARAPHPLRIEVEVETLAQAREALAARAEILLLDNMTPQGVREVVREVGDQALIEVSGGVTLETVRAYAEAGAQIISVGALTHSAPAVDISLELRKDAE
jgi:nicotinate-nucleotide pyrophosphorylase (carboxylating)